MFLDELCAELKNYFVRDSRDIHSGVFTIQDGGIDLPFLTSGQYFRIMGSFLNDGVYQYPASDLADETFYGAVWAMAVPPSVIALAAEIEAWNEKNAEILASPYQSESFGNYSYSKSSANSGSDNSVMTWQAQFEKRLRKWRRLSVL